jgi:hypothetical protein
VEAVTVEVATVEVATVEAATVEVEMAEVATVEAVTVEAATVEASVGGGGDGCSRRGARSDSLAPGGFGGSFGGGLARDPMLLHAVVSVAAFWAGRFSRPASSLASSSHRNADVLFAATPRCFASACNSFRESCA